MNGLYPISPNIGLIGVGVRFSVENPFWHLRVAFGVLK